MGKKKIAKKENKPVIKSEKSVFKVFLGHISGIAASFSLFLAIYVYMIYAGVVSAPQFINSYPENFNIRKEISSEVLDNANIKYKAWEISNKSNLETTMSISEEELFSITKLLEKRLEVLNIKRNKIIIGENQKFGKSNWKFSLIVKLIPGKEITQTILQGGYIGKVKIPNIIFNIMEKFFPLNKSLDTHISKIFNKFKYKNKSIKIVAEDGEIKLSNKKS